MSDIDEKVTSEDTSSEKKPAAKKKDKPSLGQRIAKGFREYKSEMKKIVWFSREQTFRSSVVVLIAIIISGLCIGGLDFLFSHAIQWLGSLV